VRLVEEQGVLKESIFYLAGSIFVEFVLEGPGIEFVD
jgi:hypothetical protein